MNCLFKGALRMPAVARLVTATHSTRAITPLQHHSYSSAAGAAAARNTSASALPPGSHLAGKSSLTPRIHEKLQVLQTKYAKLNERMSGNIGELGREELAKLSKDMSDTGLIVIPYRRLLELYSELVELQQMVDSGDTSLRGMAQEEQQEVLAGITECEREIVGGLLPKDSAEKAGAIMEIRAGTGGDEA
ncbi:hypothetical protein LPJ66_011861, partial [Kickxella alabastrina]